MWQNFFNPSAFWWLLLLPLIILMYFLKIRRPEHVHPSTLLWRRTIQDMRVNSPFQKLKNSLLLLLQILLVLLLVLSMARPFLQAQSKERDNVILLVDTSASMKTLEGGTTRLALAKKQARRLIDDLSSEDRMMIISFAQSAKIEQGFTSFSQLLHATIDKLTAHDNVTQIEEALSLARAMAEKVSHPSIYIISDGAIAQVEQHLAKISTFSPEVIVVGESKSNVAILAFEIKSDPKKDSHHAFVRIQNFGPEVVEGVLQLAVNDQPLTQELRLLELGPGDVNGILFKDIPLEEGIITAEFLIEQGEDSLPLDNKAYYSLSRFQKTNLCLVTTGNFFLEKALLAHDPQLTVFSPQAFEQQVTNGSFLAPEYDLVVIDNYSPPPLPTGYYLFFDALPALAGLSSEGVITASEKSSLEIIDQDSFHPVMRFVKMRRVLLNEMMQVDWPEDTIALLETQEQPIIGTIERQGSYFQIVAFDIFQSNWPLRLSFPIFIANTIQWSKQRKERNNVHIDKEGITIFAEQGPNVKLHLPQGEEISWDKNTQFPLIFSQLQKVGIYKIYQQEKLHRQVAVNLFSILESDITPQQQIKVAGKNIAAKEPQTMNQEIWHYLAFAALFFLCLEWYVFHRRTIWPRFLTFASRKN